MFDPSTQNEWLCLASNVQKRGIVYAPDFHSEYGVYTAMIPTLLGRSPGFKAPPIPQSMPGGIHITVQKNGADVFIGDVIPGVNYAAAHAPNVPTVGGSCP